MKVLQLVLVAAAVCLAATCQKSSLDQRGRGFDPAYQIDLSDPLKAKNFYLLHLLQKNSGLIEGIQNSSEFKGLNYKYKTAFLAAQSTCNGDPFCINQLLKISEEDIKAVSESLRNLSGSSELVRNDLRPSGMYARVDSLSEVEILIHAWEEAANGINRTLEVYGEGVSPHYAKIDKLAYDPNSEEYKSLVKNALNALELEREDNPMFFEPSLEYALMLLRINNRDEGGRYEPMHELENKATYQNLANIEWDSFPYSLILVLGDSPNSPGDLPNISIGGMARADKGVALYQAGKAPVLVFSGGHVNPFQTPFSEAVEMKKYVMDKYDIPENCILIDPHARHTTTNLRNTTRMVFRYQIPNDKQAIVSTSSGHSEYVTGSTFHDRCLNELGYLPVIIGNRLSATEVEFLPLLISLDADPGDPLDP